MNLDNDPTREEIEQVVFDLGNEFREQKERIAALEAENAALREHERLCVTAVVLARVMAAEAFLTQADRSPEQTERLAHARRMFDGASVALTESGFPWAVDHGLPLPGAGEPS